MDLIGSVLPRVLGVPRVEVAVSIGRQLRPNLKPVLQIMAPDGDVLAYAKLGWNPLTRSLVENEAAVLRAWSHARPKHISVPELIHEEIWSGMSMTVMSPVPNRYWGRSGRAPSADAVMEVAELGGIERSALATSSYLTRLNERVSSLPAEDVRTSGAPVRVDRVGAVVRRT